MNLFYQLVLLFTLLPLVELYLLYLLSQIIWWPITILIVIGTGFWGAFMAKLQGFYVWRDIRMQLMKGTMPADSLFDGVFILLASILLVTPGVLTDLVGFLLLIPPVRIVLRRFTKAYLSQRMTIEVRNMTSGYSQGPSTSGPHQPQTRQVEIIDVEYTKKSK